MPLFSRADIERCFGRHVLQRGEEYVARGRVVESFPESDGVIVGRVSGSNPSPYSVKLVIRPGVMAHLAGYCTCPVGNQCKHAAALALSWLTRMAGERGSDAISARLPGSIVDWLGAISLGEPDPAEEIENAKSKVFYVLSLTPPGYSGQRPQLQIVNRSLLKTGGLGAATEYKPSGIDNRQFAKHVNPYDRLLLTDLARLCIRDEWSRAEFRLDQYHGVELLIRAVNSGRCLWGNPEGPVLRSAPARQGRLVWQSDRKGDQSPSILVEGGGKALPLNPPCYVDFNTGEFGAVACGLPPLLAYGLLTAPFIPAEHVESVRKLLPGFGVPESAIPAPPIEIERASPKPVPHLDIEILFCDTYSYAYRPTFKEAPVPVVFGNLTFDYSGSIVSPSNKEEIRKVLPNRLLIISRDHAAEDEAERRLRTSGWSPAAFVSYCTIPQGKRKSFTMAPAGPGSSDHLTAYRKFLAEAVPALEKDGWVLNLGEELRFVPQERVEWDLGLQASEGEDWFEFKLGIRVDGKDVSLRPILLQLLEDQRKSVADRSARVRTLPEATGDHYVRLDGGMLLAIPRQRIQTLLRPLIELFGNVQEWPEKLKLPKSRLLDSDDMAGSVLLAGMQWKTPPELDALAKRLSEFGHLEPLSEPPGFQTTLREYQREGLAWLQFLREYEFSGILADDMGLGKTVQLLAHLQMEKQAGRLDKPCLVVAPTSTLPNWQREAERFLPDCKVVVIHGPNRADEYAAIPGSDLVITNYALLARDQALLTREEFHIVVLDEAQNIKNSATAAAKAARSLKARHRICMSGTPIENHLDELWSLFHFLMPGFLGNQTQFRQHYRTPIEQKADPIARGKLTRMVRPFMLRRTKQQVAKELPPKTIILETIEFGESQRDLYESIRIAMDEKVRALLKDQGLARSRIQVLDALLKLRQVCCDPKLVKLPAASEVSESAKLDRLMEMLEVLIEDGRRVLLFSQFTSMLDLIEERLEANDLKWVRISGETQDREAPVKRFEAGEVPLFLISLKAGGTGLNLVAADTVIHYDPWWNPAVENQATDRAYRIGQDKPVMVYKLVISGSVEEKIIELQKRKGDLAANILSDAEQMESLLSAEDLSWLLSGDLSTVG